MRERFFGDKPATAKTEELKVVPNEAFNYTNTGHLELIKEKTVQFSRTLQALRAIDYNIAMGAAISAGCYVGSYVFPLVLFSIGGACLASWNAAKRELVALQYREALTDLIAIYKWSMGKDTGDHWYKLAVKTLQDLICTLGPWVSNTTIHTWSNADLKPGKLTLSTRRTELPEEFETQLNQFAANTQTANWAYQLYGEHGMDKLYQAVQTTITTKVNDLVATTVTPK